jgi:hypothetical protein
LIPNLDKPGPKWINNENIPVKLKKKFNWAGEITKKKARNMMRFSAGSGCFHDKRDLFVRCICRSAE